MLLSGDTEQQVRAGLKDAISLLCQTGFKFNVELSIDGLLAVTLDRKEVFLVSIKEVIANSSNGSAADTVDADGCTELRSECQTAGSVLDSNASNGLDENVSCTADNSDNTPEPDDVPLNLNISSRSADKESEARNNSNPSKSIESVNKRKRFRSRRHHYIREETPPTAIDSDYNIDYDRPSPRAQSAIEIFSRNVDHHDNRLVFGANAATAEDMTMHDSRTIEPVANCKLELTDEMVGSDPFVADLFSHPNEQQLLQRVKREPLTDLPGADGSGALSLPLDLMSAASQSQALSSLAAAQQHLGLLPPFSLSAIIAAGLHPGLVMSQAALPLPSTPRPPFSVWSDSVLQTLSTTSTPKFYSDTVNTASSSSDTNSCRRPKTSLNIPSFYSHRRLNGLKSSPFLSSELNVCANCGAQRTTVWRRTEDRRVLCNACGCYFKLHKVNRPLSLVRQEIRSRCRGPKASTVMRSSRHHAVNGSSSVPLPPLIAPPTDTVLNLKISPSSVATTTNSSDD